MATMEEQVEREQAEHEAEEQAAAEEGLGPDDGEPELPEAAEEGKQGALIDRSQYEREDLALQKIDGEDVDRISLKFAGTVFLDRSQPNDVALYRKLKLGKDVTLVVEGVCNDTGAKGATDREGDLDVIVGRKAVKVHTVYLSVEDGMKRSSAGEEEVDADPEDEAQAA